MEIKRGIWMGVLWYLSVFALSILTALFYTDVSLDNIPTSLIIIVFVETILLSAPFAFWYFLKKPKVKASLKEGALLGHVFIITGIVLDSLVLILYAIFYGGSEILTYCADPSKWLWFLLIIVGTVLLIIASTSLVGLYIQKRKS